MPGSIPGRALARRFLRRRTAVAGLSVLVLVLVVTLWGASLAPYRYDEPTLDRSEPPSWSHPMGTDAIGRDLFSRVLRGAQKSTQVALLVTVVSTTVGVLLGAVAGYRKGWFDEVVSRLVDLVLTIPVLAVLLVVATRVGSHRDNPMVIALVISAVTWPGIFRVVRASFLSVAEREFVEAARAAGAGLSRIVLRHLVPNVAGPITVVATLTVAWAIVAEASLSFLGFGSEVSLGKLVDLGQISAGTRPWLFYFPGAALVLICLCVNVVGDALRDALDPQVVDAPRGKRRPSQVDAVGHLP